MIGKDGEGADPGRGVQIRKGSRAKRGSIQKILLKNAQNNHTLLKNLAMMFTKSAPPILNKYVPMPLASDRCDPSFPPTSIRSIDGKGVLC